jgi:hypothetical protein
LHVHHELMIDAAPAEVWSVLVDTASWAAWNPTLTRPDGALVEGREVPMRLMLGPVPIPMRQQVREVDPPHKLRWTSINGREGWMDVDRVFELHPTQDGRTRLVQHETATGPLTPILMPLMRRSIRRGYARLAEALRRRVEEARP